MQHGYRAENHAAALAGLGYISRPRRRPNTHWNPSHAPSISAPWHSTSVEASLTGCQNGCS